MTVASAARRDAIATGLASAQQRIRDAERSAGRPSGSVGLVVVTKTFPASDVIVLSEMGIRHVGENRDQDAAPKALALQDLDLVWHFIGQLQTNKVKSVVRYASVVESVDRVRLVNALSTAAEAAGRDLECLVQVSLDSGPATGAGRGGALPAEVMAIADAVHEAPRLVLGGVMAVAPLGEEADRAFERLARVAEQVRAEHPEATAISAGMSDDLEAAVRHGATHVRLGSAILGYRPPVR